jgi:UAF complex subunit Rrn10
VTIPVEFHPELPSSDLLKALHYYTGEYFRHHDNYDGYRTLDETALLTLGVLMEEAIKDSLGPNGALAYAENEEETS